MNTSQRPAWPCWATRHPRLHAARRFPWHRLGTLVLLIVAAGCDPRSHQPIEQPLARLVTVIEAYPESVEQTATLVGRIEPRREATLYFEVPGVIAEMFVEEGQQVEQGEPIAQLRLDDYELSVAQAEADRDAAAAELSLLKAGTREEDIDIAKAEHEAAVANATFWRSELQRRKQLFRSGRATTAFEVDEAQRQHDAAAAELSAAEARLNRAVAGPRPQEIDAAAALWQARIKAVELARVQLDRATLRAPFAGRIDRRPADVGTYVNVFPTGGVPIAFLVDLAEVEAVIAVPEALLPSLAARPKIEVMSASNERLRAEGNVVSLGATADPASGTYRLRVKLPNADGRFTAQMVVTAPVPLAEPRPAIRLPLAAVRNAEGQPYVLIVDPADDTVVRRPIMLGPVAQEHVELLGGLAAGELVIVRGQHQVAAGDRVRYQHAAAETIADSRVFPP